MSRGLLHRVEAIEAQVSPGAAPLRFVWLSWWGDAQGVEIDGRTFTRCRGETLGELRDRAIDAVQEAHQSERLIVCSWETPHEETLVEATA